ncbi:unnamed protein product [Pylaiella littoralis]
MDVQLLTFIIVGATFALYIAIAVWARAGSTNDFYVAGGGVPPVLNGMATAADWMSAASFISMAGLISFMGYDGAVYLMGWTGGYVLLALCLAPPTYVNSVNLLYRILLATATIPKPQEPLLFFCAIFVCFTYVAGQMRGVGVVFSRFLEVDIVTGVVIGMVIVFFYTVLGGMKGITYTQVAQFCVMIFAYIVPAVFISIMVTGHILPQKRGSALRSQMGRGCIYYRNSTAYRWNSGFTSIPPGRKVPSMCSLLRLH